MKNALPLMDFANIKEKDERFFILRHDVEFSIEKAYEMAQIEHDILGVQSSYFFQIRNYTYNTLAFKNMSLIKKIHGLGHKIVLHVNGNGWPSLENIQTFIKNDVAILQNVIELPIDRFSFHRPPHELLELNITIDGLINTYDKRFFHFYRDKPTGIPRVHYFSDSEHRWKYGHPLSVLKEPASKIQLLIHPYSWSKKGLDNFYNFKELLQLKEALLLQSMSDECRHFPKELLLNEKI